MIILAIQVKSPKKKLIIANLIAFPLAIFIAEGTCAILNYSIETNLEKVIYTPHSPHATAKFLGYAPYPNTNLHAIATKHNKIIYDVHYKIDQNGLRYTPSSNEKSNQCMLFFGCSFIFGYGLNDNETLPYFVGEKTNHKYKIYNFAYSGYGAHQMLSAIEHGVVDKKISGCKSTIVVYDGMSDHLIRMVGKRIWDINDPKYELVNNQAVFKGYLSDNKVKRPAILKDIGLKSQIYIYLNRWAINKEYYLSENEKRKYVQLYTAILKKSKNLSKQKYNTNRFIILFWNFKDPLIFKDYNFAKSFKENSLEYYSLEELLSGYNNKYFIKNEMPPHPNKLANEIIADFLIKKLNDTKNH